MTSLCAAATATCHCNEVQSTIRSYTHCRCHCLRSTSGDLKSLSTQGQLLTEP
jgi:hypothetical protein